jgi:hypothetical protein
MRKTSPVRSILVILLGGLLCGLGCGGGSSTGPPPDGDLPLEHFDAGFFSIDKPKGWTLVTSGRCTTFALLACDPANPMRQIYYFGSVGPVYMSQAQKDIDEDYMSHGGFAIPWIDAPVVDPFTPENYLAHWPQIADMAAATAFMSRFPKLRELKVVAVDPQDNMLPGGSTAILRGLFTQDGAVGEGMFLVTVLKFADFTGGPAGGNGYGYFICGATMPKGEFPNAIDRRVAQHVHHHPGIRAGLPGRVGADLGCGSRSGTDVERGLGYSVGRLAGAVAHRGHHGREVDGRLSGRGARLRSGEWRGL